MAADGTADLAGSASTRWGTAGMRFLRQVGIDLVRYYNRLQVRVEQALPDSPCLIVGNHGFGGIFDLNVFAVLGTLDQLAADRPVTALTHQLAWTLQVGALLETVGSRPATRKSAMQALAAGHRVVVF